MSDDVYVIVTLTLPMIEKFNADPEQVASERLRKKSGKVMETVLVGKILNGLFFTHLYMPLNLIALTRSVLETIPCNCSSFFMTIKRPKLCVDMSLSAS